jgi:hypothetical protein
MSPYLKKIKKITKKAGGVAQGVGPEFKLQPSPSKKSAIFQTLHY